MEVDNSHRLIERVLCWRTINVPYDHVDVIEQARKKSKSFFVYYLDYELFKDITGISPYDSNRPGNKVGDPTAKDVHS